jgi:hypothetical protein
MEIVIFVSIVVLLAAVIAWMLLRHRKSNSANRWPRNSQGNKTPADRLTTPADYMLASRDRMLHRRRNTPPEDIIATNRFEPLSKSQGQTEYDGYSRRDRNHVVVGTAHIKKEDHVPEPAAASPEKKEGQSGK